MNEPPTPDDTTVQEGSIYTVHGHNMIAITNTHLTGVYQSAAEAVPAPAEAVQSGMVGSDAWIRSMTTYRNSLAASLSNSTTELAQVRERLERAEGNYQRLGQALLQKAEEQDWCSEYETFAEQWDLPARSHEFYVTVTFTVSARNEEGASDMADNALNLSRYDEGIVSGPEVDITRVDE